MKNAVQTQDLNHHGTTVWGLGPAGANVAKLLEFSVDVKLCHVAWEDIQYASPDHLLGHKNLKLALLLSAKPYKSHLIDDHRFPTIVQAGKFQWGMNIEAPSELPKVFFFTSYGYIRNMWTKSGVKFDESMAALKRQKNLCLNMN